MGRAVGVGCPTSLLSCIGRIVVGLGAILLMLLVGLLLGRLTKLIGHLSMLVMVVSVVTKLGLVVVLLMIRVCLMPRHFDEIGECRVREQGRWMGRVEWAANRGGEPRGGCDPRVEGDEPLDAVLAIYLMVLWMSTSCDIVERGGRREWDTSSAAKRSKYWKE